MSTAVGTYAHRFQRALLALLPPPKLELDAAALSALLLAAHHPAIARGLRRPAGTWQAVVRELPHMGATLAGEAQTSSKSNGDFLGVSPVKCAGQVQTYAVSTRQGSQLATLDNNQQQSRRHKLQRLQTARRYSCQGPQGCHISLPDTTPYPSLHPLPRPAHAPSVVELLLGPGGLGSPVAGDCAAASLALGSCMASAPGPVFRGLLPGLAVLLDRGPHDGLTSQDFRVYETPEGLLSSEVVPKGVYVGEVVQSKNVRKARGRMRVRRWEGCHWVSCHVTGGLRVSHRSTDCYTHPASA